MTYNLQTKGMKAEESLLVYFFFFLFFLFLGCFHKTRLVIFGQLQAASFTLMLDVH